MVIRHMAALPKLTAIDLSMARPLHSYSHIAMVALAPIIHVYSECWLESPLRQMTMIVGKLESSRAVLNSVNAKSADSGTRRR